MKNEPVAWMDYLEHSDVYDLNVSGRGIPLYTHPAKTLTDEEIEDALYVADITLNNLSDGDISMERIKAFVRTVLRKAQEK
jgi:hypothetical protein